MNWNIILTRQLLSNDFILEHLSYIKGVKTTTLKHFVSKSNLSDSLKCKLEEIVSLKIQEEENAKVELEKQRAINKTAKNRKKRQRQNQ